MRAVVRPDRRGDPPFVSSLLDVSCRATLGEPAGALPGCAWSNALAVTMPYRDGVFSNPATPVFLGQVQKGSPHRALLQALVQACIAHVPYMGTAAPAEAPTAEADDDDDGDGGSEAPASAARRQKAARAPPRTDLFSMQDMFRDDDDDDDDTAAPAASEAGSLRADELFSGGESEIDEVEVGSGTESVGAAPAPAAAGRKKKAAAAASKKKKKGPPRTHTFVGADGVRRRKVDVMLEELVDESGRQLGVRLWLMQNDPQVNLGEALHRAAEERLGMPKSARSSAARRNAPTAHTDDTWWTESVQNDRELVTRALTPLVQDGGETNEGDQRLADEMERADLESDGQRLRDRRASVSPYRALSAEAMLRRTAQQLPRLCRAQCDAATYVDAASGCVRWGALLESGRFTRVRLEALPTACTIAIAPLPHAVRRTVWVPRQLHAFLDRVGETQQVREAAVRVMSAARLLTHVRQIVPGAARLQSTDLFAPSDLIVELARARAGADSRGDGSLEDDEIARLRLFSCAEAHAARLVAGSEQLVDTAAAARTERVFTRTAYVVRHVFEQVEQLLSAQFVDGCAAEAACALWTLCPAGERARVAAAANAPGAVTDALEPADLLALAEQPSDAVLRVAAAAAAATLCTQQQEASAAAAGGDDGDDGAAQDDAHQRLGALCADAREDLDEARRATMRVLKARAALRRHQKRVRTALEAVPQQPSVGARLQAMRGALSRLQDEGVSLGIEEDPPVALLTARLPAVEEAATLDEELSGQKSYDGRRSSVDGRAAHALRMVSMLQRWRGRGGGDGAAAAAAWEPPADDAALAAAQESTMEDARRQAAAGGGGGGSENSVDDSDALDLVLAKTNVMYALRAETASAEEQLRKAYEDEEQEEALGTALTELRQRTLREMMDIVRGEGARGTDEETGEPTTLLSQPVLEARSFLRDCVERRGAEAFDELVHSVPATNMSSFANMIIQMMTDLDYMGVYTNFVPLLLIYFLSAAAAEGDVRGMNHTLILLGRSGKGKSHIMNLAASLAMPGICENVTYETALVTTTNRDHGDAMKMRHEAPLALLGLGPLGSSDPVHQRWKNQTTEPVTDVHAFDTSEGSRGARKQVRFRFRNTHTSVIASNTATLGFEDGQASLNRLIPLATSDQQRAGRDAHDLDYETEFACDKPIQHRMQKIWQTRSFLTLLAYQAMLVHALPRVNTDVVPLVSRRVCDQFERLYGMPHPGKRRQMFVRSMCIAMCITHAVQVVFFSDETVARRARTGRSGFHQDDLLLLAPLLVVTDEMVVWVLTSMVQFSGTAERNAVLEGFRGALPLQAGARLPDAIGGLRPLTHQSLFAVGADGEPDYQYLQIAAGRGGTLLNLLRDIASHMREPMSVENLRRVISIGMNGSNLRAHPVRWEAIPEDDPAYEPCDAQYPAESDDEYVERCRRHQQNQRRLVEVKHLPARPMQFVVMQQARQRTNGEDVQAAIKVHVSMALGAVDLSVHDAVRLAIGHRYQTSTRTLLLGIPFQFSHFPELYQPTGAARAAAAPGDRAAARREQERLEEAAAAAAAAAAASDADADADAGAAETTDEEAAGGRRQRTLSEKVRVRESLYRVPIMQILSAVEVPPNPDQLLEIKNANAPTAQQLAMLTNCPLNGSITRALSDVNPELVGTQLGFCDQNDLTLIALDRYRKSSLLPPDEIARTYPPALMLQLLRARRDHIQLYDNRRPPLNNYPHDMADSVIDSQLDVGHRRDLFRQLAAVDYDESRLTAAERIVLDSSRFSRLTPGRPVSSLLDAQLTSGGAHEYRAHAEQLFSSVPARGGGAPAENIAAIHAAMQQRIKRRRRL